eukprot:12507120-Prorocentrum_lima.AAC.1
MPSMSAVLVRTVWAKRVVCHALVGGIVATASCTRVRRGFWTGGLRFSAVTPSYGLMRTSTPCIQK